MLESVGILLIVGVHVLLHPVVRVERVDGLGRLGGAGDGLHHGAGALLAVAHHKDVLDGIILIF